MRSASSPCGLFLMNSARLVCMGISLAVAKPAARIENPVRIEGLLDALEQPRQYRRQRRSGRRARLARCAERPGVSAQRLNLRQQRRQLGILVQPDDLPAALAQSPGIERWQLSERRQADSPQRALTLEEWQPLIAQIAPE